MTDQLLPTVQVQIVLYEPDVGAFERLMESLSATITFALGSRAVGSVVVRIGDSSLSPAIGPDQQRICHDLLGANDLEYRHFDRNLGSAGGNNALWTGASADFFLVINPDTYASPDLLVELLVPFADTSVGIVDARQIPLEHPKVFDRTTGDTSWASMACALVRGAVLDDVTGFDHENFFLYADDVDFSWRARLAGWRVVHRPSARVFHDKRLTNGGHVMAGPAEFYYSAEAALLMASKYSRLDLAHKWASELEASGNDQYLRAATEFRKREATGTLPHPIDPHGRVAEFVGREYGKNRFTYSD